MEFTYKYPRMLVTVDAIVFLKDESTGTPKILLIQRKNYPYQGCYALPGGFVEMGETLKEAATRELFEETGLNEVDLTQLATFDKIDRDPRDRNICIVHYGFTTMNNANIAGGDDAETAEWFSIDKLPSLAFDHTEIIEFAREKLKI
jgi:8-oxo-dGTP diphosphatase